MLGSRFWPLAVTSIVLALTIVQTGRSQTGLEPATTPGFFDTTIGSAWAGMYPWSWIPVGLPADSSVSTCKVYSLSDFGDDANLGKWIADTIPQMIQPGSWKADDGKSKLSYYAPGKVLVINQTAAVHTQVDEFLKSLKKSLPQQAAVKRDPQVMQAQFVPDARPVAAPSPAQAYPVPYPPATPKHLFHFIIRYEGEGIIDANVVKFAKALAQEAAKGQGDTSAPIVAYTPRPPVDAPAPGPAPSPQLTPASSATGSSSPQWPNNYYSSPPPQSSLPPPPMMPPADLPPPPPPGS